VKHACGLKSKESEKVSKHLRCLGCCSSCLYRLQVNSTLDTPSSRRRTRQCAYKTESREEYEIEAEASTMSRCCSSTVYVGCSSAVRSIPPGQTLESNRHRAHTVNRHLGGSGSVDVFVKVRHVCLVAQETVGRVARGVDSSSRLYMCSAHTQVCETLCCSSQQSEMREYLSKCTGSQRGRRRLGTEHLRRQRFN
jgi:hypothetical protein